MSIYDEPLCIGRSARCHESKMEMEVKVPASQGTKISLTVTTHKYGVL